MFQRQTSCVDRYKDPFESLKLRIRLVLTARQALFPLLNKYEDEKRLHELNLSYGEHLIGKGSCAAILTRSFVVSECLLLYF
mmetsp:Transcript_9703/g.11057  ORF Transcript_9703/g.11057 Transcript_9703/m.11057 type:complete len:82 (-) Transcript_9703:86-331(-)